MQNYTTLQYANESQTVIQAKRQDGSWRIIEAGDPEWGGIDHSTVLAHEPEPIPSATPYDVDAELERRQCLDISIGNHTFQCCPISQRRIDRAAFWAQDAIMNGHGAVGDYKWNSNEEDFEWILADNTRLKMDAPSVVDLASRIAKRNSRLVLKARDLKDMDPIPDDYADDSYWVITPPTE